VASHSFLCCLQVAERAIYVLNNESMMNFISRHRTTLLPILFSALCRNTNSIALKALAMQAAQQAAQQAAAAGADDSDAAAAGGDASPAKGLLWIVGGRART